LKLTLHSLNYSPELTGIGKYNGEMCCELVKRGINVTAIVAPPYYPEWKTHKGFNKYQFSKHQVDGVTVVRCPLYVPKNVTTKKRFMHLGSFAFSSGMVLLSKVFRKPDIIMLVQPSLFCAPFTLLYAQVTGAKSIMHIQDFEVDALFGLGMMGNGRVSKFARSIEKWLMSRFDAISTISYSMMDNAVAKGVDINKIIHFPNWSDTEFVTPDTCSQSLKNEWGFKPSDKIILYAGNIGNKQGLEIVLNAAKHYENDNNVKFIFVGTGSYVNKLKDMAEQQSLSNVFFKPLLPWDRVPEMLTMADIHLVIQKKGAADAVLPSKLTNILSAGGYALVTAEGHTELGKIAHKHPGIYSCIEPENPSVFIDGIQCLLSNSVAGHNIIAREYAEQYLSKDQILNQFTADIKALVSTRNLIAVDSVS